MTYSFPRLVREALRRHSRWEEAWRSPAPKPRYGPQGQREQRDEARGERRRE